MQQAGAPQDVYDYPANTTVARFIGSPAMNLLPGTLQYEDGWSVGVLGSKVPLGPGRELAGAQNGQSVLIGLRPDEVAVDLSTTTGGPSLLAQVEIVERMGSESWITALCNGTPVICKGAARIDASRGQAVSLQFAGGAARVFDAETGRSLTDMSQSGDGAANAHLSSGR